MTAKPARAAVFSALNLLLANFVVAAFPPGVPRFFLGMWLPALTAILFALADPAPAREILSLRVGTLRGYIAAGAYASTAGVLTVLMGLGSGMLRPDPVARLNFVSVVLTLLIWVAAGMGEELGWRGYLHAQLRERRHAPLIIGLVWAGWHARALMAAAPGARWMLAVFTAVVLLASYFLSWLVETSGSIAVCAFFHGAWDCLRMKIFFGNPERGVSGLFVSSAPRFTEMEGVFGLLSLLIVGTPFVYLWYRDFGEARR